MKSPNDARAQTASPRPQAPPQDAAAADADQGQGPRPSPVLPHLTQALLAQHSDPNPFVRRTVTSCTSNDVLSEGGSEHNNRTANHGTKVTESPTCLCRPLQQSESKSN